MRTKIEATIAAIESERAARSPQDVVFAGLLDRMGVAQSCSVPVELVTAGTVFRFDVRLAEMVERPSHWPN